MLVLDSSGSMAEKIGGDTKIYIRADESSCGSGYGLVANVAGTRNVVSTETSSWADSETSPCTTAAAVVVDVSGFVTYLAGRPFELLVREEPPVSSTKGLPPAESAVRWQKMAPGTPEDAPVPGSNLSDAPTIASGTYATSILTGEKQVFAVDLDWGQRLQVEALVPPRTGTLARAVGVLDSLDVQVLGSMRGAYTSLSLENGPRQSIAMGVDTETYRASASTATIRYLNRTAGGDPGYAATPGLQYVVISKSRAADQDQFLMPYSLVVQVIGTAKEGAPTYVTPASPTPSPTPTPSPSLTPSVEATPGGTASEPGGGAGVSLGAAAGIGAGALLLGAAVTGVVLTRRRRRMT